MTRGSSRAPRPAPPLDQRHGRSSSSTPTERLHQVRTPSASRPSTPTPRRCRDTIVQFSSNRQQALESSRRPLTDGFCDSIPGGRTSIRPIGEQYLGGGDRPPEHPATGERQRISDRLAAPLPNPVREHPGPRDPRRRAARGDATSAAVLVRDAKLNYMDNRDAWASDLQDTEVEPRGERASRGLRASRASVVQRIGRRRLPQLRHRLRGARDTPGHHLRVVRFGSFRVLGRGDPRPSDCLVAVGLVAIASVIYNKLPGVQRTLGILPFKIDLNLVAAVLAIPGLLAQRHDHHHGPHP